MTDLASLKLFATHPHDCSYLDDRQATTVFVDPEAELDSEVYSQLSEVGFRRSGPHLYRPHCQQCNACISSRVPAALFTPTRSQKRCLKRNAHLTYALVEDIDTPEHYALYERYINEKHCDGDMYPPSKEQYQNFLTAEWGVTRFMEVRDHGKIVAVAVTDMLKDGLSAIYTFYDPSLEKSSLGVYCILTQIRLANDLGLPYVYLGYWIKQCAKMSYKIQYRPIELLIDRQWLQLS